MFTCKDQIGQTITYNEYPRRIISLVPSQTELLFDLGLDEEIIGITKFCIHPDKWFRTKQRIGGTKNLQINTIRKLQPDLVIANKEENTKDQIEEIRQFCPVWTSDISNLRGALDMMTLVGQLTNRQNRALELVEQIKLIFKTLPINQSTKKAAYLIWKDPFMAAGGGTFIHNMMQYGGLENVFLHCKRYPVVTLDELRKSSMEIILLSTEPYPFSEKDLAELSIQIPGKKIVLADGEMFSWYGSRLLQTGQYLRNLSLNV
jgi:ABC-type Fe3+-hydroxamate transport system substrate-binding protein